MNGRNEENLQELVGKFPGSENTAEVLEDLQRAEQILSESPAPEPSGELIADIKAKVSEALAGKKVRDFRHAAYRVAAVAAVFIIFAGIAVKLRETGPVKIDRIQYGQPISEAVWETDDIAAADVSLATLIVEVETVEDEFIALQVDEGGINGYSELVELELELVEIDSDFWKG